MARKIRSRMATVLEDKLADIVWLTLDIEPETVRSYSTDEAHSILKDAQTIRQWLDEIIEVASSVSMTEAA